MFLTARKTTQPADLAASTLCQCHDRPPLALPDFPRYRETGRGHDSALCCYGDSYPRGWSCGLDRSIALEPPGTNHGPYGAELVLAILALPSSSSRAPTGPSTMAVIWRQSLRTCLLLRPSHRPLRGGGFSGIPGPPSGSSCRPMNEMPTLPYTLPIPPQFDTILTIPPGTS